MNKPPDYISRRRPAPSMVPEETMIGPQLPKVADVEQVISQVIEQATPPEPPPPDFVHLAEQCADAMVQSAQTLFNDAENNLQRTKLYADELRVNAKEQANLHRSFSDRLKTYGGHVLKAHDEFHNGKPTQ